MFGRKDKSQEPAPADSDNPGKKGRPTPSRKEVEAANKARAKAAARGKSGRSAVRGQRVESSRKIREAMRSGDERYLPARDKGPVKRFVRDTVDSRLTMAELFIPLMVMALVAGGMGFVALANSIELVTILFVAVDTVFLMTRLRRELTRRFPDQSTRGTTTYALIRLIQLRFLRMPKPQVKIGQKLPDKY